MEFIFLRLGLFSKAYQTLHLSITLQQRVRGTLYLVSLVVAEGAECVIPVPRDSEHCGGGRTQINLFSEGVF